MDNLSVSPENMPASEMEMLLYRLQSLFLDCGPGTSMPWRLRRYVDGRRENTLDISHAPDSGSYLMDASLRDPSAMISGSLTISDVLTPNGNFFSSNNTNTESESYNERRAQLFNELLIRSTKRPYGRLGRMLLRAMRARYRWSI